MFLPMDISKAQWEHSPEGLTAGGMGLSLQPSSLIKIARMLLNKGVFEGKRIVPEAYITLAVSSQAIKQDEALEKFYSGNQYGFQFHISPNHTYRADGAFGQFCVVCPKRNLAIVAVSQYTKAESFLALADKYFIQHERDTDTDTISLQQLRVYLSGLSFALPPQEGKREPFVPCSYALEDNELNIKEVGLSASTLRIQFLDGLEDELDLDFTGPVYGQSHFIKDLHVHPQEHCLFARWADQGDLMVTVYYIETPYVGEYSFRFMDSKVVFSFNINVSMTLKGFTVTGTRIDGPIVAPSRRD